MIAWAMLGAAFALTVMLSRANLGSDSGWGLEEGFPLSCSILLSIEFGVALLFLALGVGF